MKYTSIYIFELMLTSYTMHMYIICLNQTSSVIASVR